MCYANVKCSARSADGCSDYQFEIFSCFKILNYIYEHFLHRNTSRSPQFLQKDLKYHVCCFRALQQTLAAISQPLFVFFVFLYLASLSLHCTLKQHFATFSIQLTFRCVQQVFCQFGYLASNWLHLAQLAFFNSLKFSGLKLSSFLLL